MKIGYPCINRSVDCTANRTFRLKNYSEERLIQTVEHNLDCLEEILAYNLEHDFLFFRISSDLVPFASHPVCTFDWQDYFEERLGEIGDFINDKGFRISMHPDQYVLINSPDEDIFDRSVTEFCYHAEVLDLMELDNTARIQIHVGGVYADKETSIKRFVKRYRKLPGYVKDRLTIENDHRLYSLAECIKIYGQTGIPILFDVFHHYILNQGESTEQAFELFTRTWEPDFGIPMVDYSSQEPKAVKGKHSETIDIDDFRSFIEQTEDYDFDIMLEIKDKEKSAKCAREILKEDPSFRTIIIRAILDKETDLIEVFTSPDFMLIQMAKGILERADIIYIMKGNMSDSIHIVKTTLVGDLNPVSIFVRRQDAEKALGLLSVLEDEQDEYNG
ncbi:UV DNA damage repair endonuclease UvsE [candidate division WOR-3 bacterium]|nr:UV DNA damage repair endonuclease UvsE [candidate division WOR-3 bacterium]